MNNRILLFRVVLGLAMLALVAGLVLGLVTCFISPNDGSHFRIASEGSESSGSSVAFIQVGLTGTVETDIIVSQLANSEADSIILGTSKGIYILRPDVSESLQTFVSTPGSVIDIVLMDDITGDDQKDLVVITDDTYFPNVRCYDSATGEKLWDFAPRMEIFDEYVLWTEIETRTIDIALIGDLDGDAASDVVVSSGYSLYLVSGVTGEQIWEYETEGNLWRVVTLSDVDGDGAPDIAAGAQDGALHVVNGATGMKVYRKAMSEECTVYDDEGDEYATVDTAVWDILPVYINGNQKVVVSAEDGKVRLVNLMDGEVDWKSDALIEYVASSLFNYYEYNSKYPTSPWNDNYFNLRLLEVEDVTGDGISEFIASSYVGARRGGHSGYQGAYSGLFLIDVVSESVVWENKGELTGLSLTSVATVETADLGSETVIVVPGSEGVDLIAIDDGEDLGSLQVGLASTSAYNDEFRVKRFGEDKFLLVSNSQDLVYISVDGLSGQLEWNYPRISGVAMMRGSFTGDETLDLLIYARRRHTQGHEYGTRTLYVVDGATEEKAWIPYEMAYEDFASTEGITDLQATSDLNGDGYMDILGYIQSTSGSENLSGDDHKIIAISGSDGAVLLDQQVVDSDYYYQLFEQYTGKQVDDEHRDGDDMIDKRIYSLGVMENCCLSSEPVVIVGCNRDVFVLSNQGDLLWTRTYDSWRYQKLFDDGDQDVNYVDLRFQLTGDADIWGGANYHVLEDINGDDYDDLLAAGGGCLVLGESKGTSEVDFNFEMWGDKIFDSSGADAGYWMDESQVGLVDDLDGDGAQEISFNKGAENIPNQWIVISSGSSEELFRVEQQGGDSDQFLDWASADFNGDGYADHMLYQRWSEGYEGPRMRVLSGLGGHDLWEYPDFRDSNLFNDFGNFAVMPATPISDISGDGKPDLALIRILGDQPGAQLLVYDISNDEELKRIIIEETDPDRKWDPRWHPGVAIEEIGDCNGDGRNEVALVALVGDTQEEKEAQLAIVDLEAGQLVVDFNIIGTQLTEMGGGRLGLVGLSGEVYFLDTTHSFSITSLAEGSTQTSPLTLAWTGASAGSFSQVYVDDIRVAQTNDSQVSINIASGEHEVKVRSIDENGRGVWASEDSTVTKSPMPVALAFIVLILLVFIAVAMTFHMNLVGVVIRHRPRRGGADE